MNDNLKEKIEAVVLAFKTSENNSFSASCCCDDYCECYWNSKEYYDDDMQALINRIEELQEYFAENLSTKE